MSHPSFFDILDGMNPEVKQNDLSGAEKTIFRFGRFAAQIQDWYWQEWQKNLHQINMEAENMEQYFGWNTFRTFNSMHHTDRVSSIEEVIKRVGNFGNLDNLSPSLLWGDTSWFIWSLLWHLQYSSKEERDELLKCLSQIWPGWAKDEKLIGKLTKILKNSDLFR